MLSVWECCCVNATELQTHSPWFLPSPETLPEPAERETRRCSWSRRDSSAHTHTHTEMSTCTPLTSNSQKSEQDKQEVTHRIHQLLQEAAVWTGLTHKQLNRSTDATAVELKHKHTHLSDHIKSNHFYCHITTARVPWWVKFLRACSRQCRKTKQFTYRQYTFTDCTEDNVQNTRSYTQYTQCTYKDILSYQYTVCTHSTLCTHLYIVIC